MLTQLTPEVLGRIGEFLHLQPLERFRRVQTLVRYSRAVADINRRLEDMRSDVLDTHTLENILHACAADSRQVLQQVFGNHFPTPVGAITYEDGAMIYARFNHLLTLTSFGGRFDTVLDHGVRALGLYYPNFRFAISRVDELLTVHQLVPFLAFHEFPQNTPCPEVDFAVQQLIMMTMVYIRTARCVHSAVVRQLHATIAAKDLAAARVLASDADTLALLSVGRFARSARTRHIRNYISRSQPWSTRVQ